MLHDRLIYRLNCLTKFFVIDCFVSTAYCWSGDGVELGPLIMLLMYIIIASAWCIMEAANFVY